MTGETKDRAWQRTRRIGVGLRQYHAKRHFRKTPEPRGTKQPTRRTLRFVVQKHAASHLHYDFRLELDGTLKSWAVPKGPSLNPQDRRLAIMVEDHPLDYRTFEGTIPEGNYGAGGVIVWDQGTYCSRHTADRRESERLLREGLRKGHLSILLNGEKLKGEFSLVKLKHGKGNEWLLIKKSDAWASSTDVKAQDRSVRSGRSLDEIAHAARKGARRGKRRIPTSKLGRGLAAALRPLPVSAMPRQIKPMLAALVEQPFNRSDWLFEIKWDGYRAIAEIDNKGVSLYSRNHKSFADRFAPLVEALRDFGHTAVLDGEIVVVDPQGRSRFQLLQNYQKTGTGQLRYYVFDLLYLDGRDLRSLPLRQRKELLTQILGSSPNILLSEHVEEQGVAFFEAATAQGLEGIIAKDGNSPYREGQRSDNWLKIKIHKRQEAVICGFTEPRGGRKDLGALVLGVFEGKELRYIGHTGGGFNDRALTDMRSLLEPLVQGTCPFRKAPKTNAPVHWVKPTLVCEVKFQEWTEDGSMRQPIFLGLREDKEARAVHRETAISAEEVLENESETFMPTPTRGARSSANGRQAKRGSRKPARLPEPPLTNLGKVFWPEEGYTKGDLIDYYRDIAPVILPYLRDRPEALHRHPNGINHKSFFQKDVSRQPPPEWVETVTIAPESGDRPITYLVCQNKATLLYLGNLGCIEINPWNARVQALSNPDYAVIDLDPEDIPFPKVIEAALAVRRILDQAGAESACKTSGKRGLHIFIPLGARYDTEQARQFAEIVAHMVHEQLPETTSIVRSPALRQQRVYLDFLQNRRGQTLVAPYAVRPYAGATVSTPLRWKEVSKKLDPAAFTILTLRKRLDRVGDLWQPVLGPGIDLPTCLERLAKRNKRAEHSRNAFR
jgi:bifunctional non-homologous end joining protein LigD